MKKYITILESDIYHSFCFKLFLNIYDICSEVSFNDIYISLDYSEFSRILRIQ